MKSKVKQMRTKDKEKREKLLAEVVNDWHAVEGELINQLFSEDNQRQCSAAFLLGLFHFRQSTRYLAEKITLENEFRSRTCVSEWYWDRHPAAEALLRIGPDSIPALIEKLENSDDEKIRELSLETIVYIQQPEPANSLLERAIENQADEAKKNNLRKALMDIKPEENPVARR